MDTSNLDKLINENSDLRNALYDKLMNQINNNLTDLKELSVSFTEDLVRKDGSSACAGAFKVVLFKTNLFTSNTVSVYLDTSNGNIVYDYFDSEIGDYLPQNISPEQFKILLSVSDNFENAMFVTNPSKVIDASISALNKENVELKNKLQ